MRAFCRRWSQDVASTGALPFVVDDVESTGTYLPCGE